MKESIWRAAIIRGEDVHVGYRHANIMQALSFAGLASVKNPILAHEQGFITNQFEFVSRQLAAEIAWKAGQIPNRANTLFSEDLY